MKKWLRRYEWMELACCADSAVHTMDNPSISEMESARNVCQECLVRPECIEWAIQERACSVVVAGVYLPDPENKKELKQVYAGLKDSLDDELRRRGDV